MGMKITLDSDSIVAAIKEHIENQGIRAEGKIIDVELVISGRPAIATADIEFIDPNSIKGATATVTNAEKEKPKPAKKTTPTKKASTKEVKEEAPVEDAVVETPENVNTPPKVGGLFDE